MVRAPETRHDYTLTLTNGDTHQWHGDPGRIAHSPGQLALLRTTTGTLVNVAHVVSIEPTPHQA